MFNEVPILPHMANSSSIEYLNMTPAKNGFIISYTEKTKGSGKNTYDNVQYKECKEVFDFETNEGKEEMKEDIDKAFNRFRELAMRQYNEMNYKE
jgi:hypothetical protein